MLPKSCVKKVMRSAGNGLWIPDDAVELMMQLAEDYIRETTAKAILIARNAGCTKRIRKKDLATAVV